MLSSSPTSPLNVDVRPGKPPILRVDATRDAPRWAAEHRDALGAAVVEYGSLLVRGLGLRDVGETEWSGWTETYERMLASIDTESGLHLLGRVLTRSEVLRVLQTWLRLQSLWTETPATYHGQWYQLDQAACERPDPAIPILVGTNGPKALKVAARLADWWNWDGPWEKVYRRPYQLLRSACEEIGRPFDEITLTASLSISMPADPSSFQPNYEHSFYPGQVFDILGPTPADVVREIERLVDLGVRHFQVGVSDMTTLRRFVNEVVPAVRMGKDVTEGVDGALPQDRF